MTKGNKHDTQLAGRIPLWVQFCMNVGYLLLLLLLRCRSFLFVLTEN